jgi:hypothetical protein
VNVLDLELIGIVFSRVYTALLVLVCLSTGQWIRDEARDAGWPLAWCSVITAGAWAIALGLVAGYVTHTIWLEIGALLTFLIAFLASGVIGSAIAEHPPARTAESGQRGSAPTSGRATRPDHVARIEKVDRWLGLVAGVLLGGSAFYGRSALLGAGILVLGWLASRRPIPVVWMSLLGVAAGLVGGGLVTVDPAPVTIAVPAIGFLWLALVLRRLARGADALATLPTARPWLW